MRRSSLFKKIFFTISLLLIIPYSFGIEANTSFFDLNSIVDAVLAPLSEQDNKDVYSFIENQKTFEQITQKFLQGNVVVAYDEYKDFLEKIDNDLIFLSLAEEFYKVGLFSLGDEAIEKIQHKDEIKFQIEDLQKTYKPKRSFDIEEEKNFAKNFVAINYENYAEETSFAFGNNRELLNKSDYGNFLMAQAQVQLKQYHQAKKFIDKALSINPNNANYALYKAKILYLEGKYNDGLNFIRKLESSSKITKSVLIPFEIEKERFKYELEKNPDEKNIHKLNIYYLEENSYRAISECEDIIGVDKDNYKILTQLSKNYIKTGDENKAKEAIEKAYSINKKYPETLEVMGDINFINFNYANALKYYILANKKIKSSELYNKMALSSFLSGDKKNVDKYTNIARKINPSPFYELYDISSTTAKYLNNLQNNVNLSEEFLKKSIYINPTFKPAWLRFAFGQINTKNYNMAENVLTGISMQRHPDFNFYYVNAILLNDLNKKHDAIESANKAFGMNPDFIPAKNLKSAIEADLRYYNRD